MLVQLIEKTKTTISVWPKLFKAIANEWYKGNLELDEVLVSLKNQYLPQYVAMAYRRLENLHSVTTRGEPYRESIDGKLSVV